MRVRDLLEIDAGGGSRVHRLPAGRKLGWALALVIVVAASPVRSQPMPGWLIVGGVALVCAAVWVAGRIPARAVLTRVLLLEPFVLGVAMLSLFQADGVAAFLAIVSKSTVCLVVTVLLTLTTPFPAIARVLGRSGVPPLLVTTITLLYRYLFVLLEETERMRLARASRSFRPSRRRTWWLTASMIGELFVRSAERAERIYAAMCSRGWR